MTILVTGFTPFPGAPENPTMKIVEALDGARAGGVRIVARVLPTLFAVFEDHLSPLIAEIAPRAILSFGLSAKATGFMLERTAVNACGAGRLDAGGLSYPARWLDPLGPATCTSALPLAAMAAALEEAGIPWDWSDSAGDYICNLIFYRTRRAHGGLPTGFVHVPYTEDQRARLGLEAEALSEAQLIDGARVCAEAVAGSLD